MSETPRQIKERLMDRQRMLQHRLLELNRSEEYWKHVLDGHNYPDKDSVEQQKSELAKIAIDKPPLLVKLQHVEADLREWEAGNPPVVVPPISLAEKLEITKPQNDSRRRILRPLLESKGWSIEDWALDATVADHTARDYYDGKTAKLRPSTRKKLADSLEIPVDQLPE